MNEEVKQMIDKSEKTRYSISQENNLNLKTLDNWYLGHTKINTSLLRLIVACSEDDKELLNYVKLFSRKK